MTEFSRRQFLYLSAVSPFVYEFSALAAESEGNKSASSYPRTMAVLQDAFMVETLASRNYIGYTSKALSEAYPNIAYLFDAFSRSEQIHAGNYKRVFAALGHEVKTLETEIDVRDTKANLQQAARNELKKIATTYPDFIKELEAETCDEAIMYCMYSWKSHQQHEAKVREILKYSGMLFGRVSSKIEGLKLDFHVCRVCGSTLDEAPQAPCTICNRSMSNYFKVERPT
ncbi:MAG: ferritin family protein [Syntrophorhabdales bacterium]|jgi:rubrerythrin